MKQHSKSLCTLAGFLFLFTPLLSAASGSSEGPEDYRIELSTTLWRMNTNGTIHADGTPLDLINDLGVSQRQRIFGGRLTWKFKNKYRFVLEGTPISIQGLNTVNRNVTYFGQQYAVSDTLKSSAQISYIYGGLHRDWYSGRRGRFGSSIGAAYLGLAGSLQAEQSGINRQGSTPFGLPFVGVDFRFYLIPNRRWIALEGAVRGLPAGAYGHWLEGYGAVGGWVGPIALQLGYREILVDFHQTGVNPNGLNLRFYGPMASVLWNW
jgi:hypothetical protein